MPTYSATQTAWDAAMNRVLELRKQKNEHIAAKSKAAELGDLRENGDYHAAKESAEQTTRQMVELEHTLANTHVVAPNLAEAAKPHIANKQVGIGVVLNVEWLNTNETETMQVTSALDEPGVENGIRYNSPFGQAILGQPEGATVKWRAARVRLSNLRLP